MVQNVIDIRNDLFQCYFLSCTYSMHVHILVGPNNEALQEGLQQKNT